LGVPEVALQRGQGGCEVFFLLPEKKVTQPATFPPLSDHGYRPWGDGNRVIPWNASG
jgi:hypothetical protein